MKYYYITNYTDGPSEINANNDIEAIEKVKELAGQYMFGVSIVYAEGNRKIWEL